MSKRKIMLAALSLCMVAILAVGGSLAYLTDTDNATNVFTVGNVQIEQYEKDRDGNPYDREEPKKVFPIVDDKTGTDGLHTGENYIDKIVTVENTGTESAYIRTFIAIPAVLDDGPTNFDAGLNILHWNGASAEYNVEAANRYWDAEANDGEGAYAEVMNEWYWDKVGVTDWPANGGDWNGYVAEINGIVYNVYIATHVTPVEAGATTAATLLGVYFDKTLDYGDITDDGVDNPTYFVVQNGKKVAFEMPTKKVTNADGTETEIYEWDVLVASQAVQVQGFESNPASNADAYDALAHAFGTTDDIDGDTDLNYAEFTCPFGGVIKSVFTNESTNP